MPGTERVDGAELDLDAAPGLAPGDRVDGLYRVERLLGEGGGGVVYLVRDERLDGARFALKVLHGRAGETDEALSREARLAARVSSAHVVKVVALGRTTGGAPYLLMEYVEGSTLEKRIGLRELTLPEAIDVVRQLCLALEAAHAQRLVHGDVSLRNVFVTPKPDGSLHLQLGDFGLARHIRQRSGSTISIDAGPARGTPRFMAPEAISGEAVDERGDLFSVGVVLYRLVAGVFPFDGNSAREVLAAVLRGQAPPLSRHRRVSRQLEELVARCLASDPRRRIASAGDLREALERVAAAGPGSWRPRLGVRRAARFGLITVAVAGLGAGAVVGLRTHRARAAIPLGDTLRCPDTQSTLPGVDGELRRAIAVATCARIGAPLDLDWGGGAEATDVVTRLEPEGEDGYRLDLEVAGRVESGRGATPRLAAVDVATRVLARVRRPVMSEADVRRWGAADPESAAAVRALWRRRTAMVSVNLDREVRDVLARDPSSPMAHLLLAEIERDPARRREARAHARAGAERLPPERAAALRASLDAAERPEESDRAIEALRRSVSFAPDDVDLGVLYVAALTAAGQTDTARAVVDRLHERFPRTAALALHHAAFQPERRAETGARYVGWLVDALPEARAGSASVCLLVGSGRLTEAESAIDFGRRLGIGGSAWNAETVLALALGDPDRIERATAGHEGLTSTWSHLVGARLRLAGLVLRGQTAAAETHAVALIAARRAAGDAAGAVGFATERLRVARLSGGAALPAADVDWLAQAVAREGTELDTFASAITEVALARGDDAERALATLDGELDRRAAGRTMRLAGARLRTLALVRRARGDAEAARRWREGEVAWLSDRVRAAYDAALALDAAGDLRGAESAYRLAASPYEIDRHPFESIAARLRLADLLEELKQPAEIASLMSHVDRAWAGADPGLRERLRRVGPAR